MNQRVTHPLSGRLVTIEELRRLQTQARGVPMLIRAPVGPWHHPDEIRGWIAQLEANRAEVDQEQTAGFDLALKQARGWLVYAEKRWSIGTHATSS